MYEQLLEADVVIADLSTSNRNALYELGVRHALRPFTTLVIAEDGIKTFPFDVNHVLIRQYRHLGEDIGYDEVMRVRGILQDAITTLHGQDPRRNDRPIYTFIEGLSPPARAARAQANLQSMLTGSPTATVPALAAAASDAADDPARQTHSMLMQRVDELQAAKDFAGAKALLRVILDSVRKGGAAGSESAYIVQRLALVTYKSKQPSEEAALHEAAQLLSELAPERSNDTETLGLWGAVHKRLWELTQDSAMLDQAIRSYERGFYLRHDHYNGINYAFLLNVRAAHGSSRAEAVADYIQARRIRQEVKQICLTRLEQNPAPKPGGDARVQYDRSRYWVLATLAEAALGLGDDHATWLGQAHTLPVDDWMKDSTDEQLRKLAPLLAASPLGFVVEKGTSE
jgi:hypothetical protein